MNTQDILNGSPFELDGNNEMHFLLQDRNWNDYGYYTWYKLLLYIPQYKYPFGIADFNIMNKGQQVGTKPYWDSSSYKAFVSSNESVEKLFLLLSPKQRNELLNVLKINFDFSDVKNEPVFKNSILRGRSLEDFINLQKYSKDLMKSNIDASKMINNNKLQLKLLLEELIKEV